jgi:predicted O-methyltransferase YrrM
MTPNTTWSDVDGYISRLFGLSDATLESTVRRSRDRGLPDIQVSECHGQLLHVLAKALGAQRILEVGTLGGFSTIFLARALQSNGVVVSLELNPTHAAVARENIDDAGLSDLVEVVEGNAHESLARMISEGVPAFDFIFLDAEKKGYSAYLEAVLQLSRPGTMIVADNVVRDGEVVDPDSEDAMVVGAREFNAKLAATPSVSGTVIQTVGIKGYDGLAIAVVE